MKTILCQNRHTDVFGKSVECRRFLASLTDTQVEILRNDPEEKSIFRCPKCHHDDRWVKIHYQDGKLTFSVCDEGERPNFDERPAYVETNVMEQVA